MTTSQSRGGPSRKPSRALIPGLLSSLDLLPLVHPFAVGGAVVAAAVDALGLRSRPVVDLGRVIGVERVVLLAERRVLGLLARLGLGRRLTEPLGDLGVDRRGGDPV